MKEKKEISVLLILQCAAGDVPRFYQENWSEIEKSLDKTGIGMSGAENIVQLPIEMHCRCGKMFWSRG